MKISWQVVTTPTVDTPGTVISLNFPDRRYFFGQLSEGTQRACTERGVGVAKLTDVFLTGRTEWKNTGGLIGLVLTVADATASANAAIEEEERRKAARREAQAAKQEIKALRKGQKSFKPQAHLDPRPQTTSDPQADGPLAARSHKIALPKGHLTIHGATNLVHTMATARRFVFRKGMPVYFKEYDSESITKQAAEDPFEKPSWSDHNIKVWMMPIKPRSSPMPGLALQPQPQSPRKRNLEEFQEKPDSDDQFDPHTKKKLMLQSIVSDMYNSSWRMDALTETPLAEVKMPATLFVRDSETKDLKPYKGPVPGDNRGEPLPDINVFVRRPWPGALVEELPPTSPSEEAICYVVRSNDVRGKFDAAKAQELNVRKGRDYGALTQGKSVKSIHGKTITPDMVLGPSRLGKGVAIIDLPSPEYVEDLVNRPEWKSPAVTTELKAFIWMLGPGLGEHPKLREFIASMSHCKHTVSSTDYCPNYLALTSTAASSVRLACLRGENYSIPVHDNVTLPQSGTPTAGPNSTVAAVSTTPFEPLEPGFIIDTEPKFGLNKTEVMTRLNPETTIRMIPRSVQQRMETIRRRVFKPQFQERLQKIRADFPGANAEIITLGTGSSSPSKYRNVSATLLHVPGTGYYLFDCGENTLGQLKRVFEPEELRHVLQNLRMIWISHLHADHHLGTTSVIKAWYQENYPNGTDPTADPEPDIRKIFNEKRLFVVSDGMMIEWLEEYASVENYGFDKLVPLCAYPRVNGSTVETQFVYRHCRGDGTHPGEARPRTTNMSFDTASNKLTQALKSSTGLADLLTTKVKHCLGSLAVSLVFPNGFKVSYSGDCRPSEKFAAIGRNSTLLIHEATFQNDMVGQATAKRHCTAAEALEVGRLMQARNILLTHFSQRYQKIAYIDQREGSAQDTTQRDDIESFQATTESADPDIPLDNPEDQPAEEESAVSLRDDIRLPAKSARKGPNDTWVAGVTVPVVAAFDYLRVRVGDFALTQAYAPALEKMIEIEERASDKQLERRKKERQEFEGARKAEKNKKWAAKAAAAAAMTVVAPDTAGGQSVKKRSVWSASESESGWDTSDWEE